MARRAPLLATAFLVSLLLAGCSGHPSATRTATPASCTPVWLSTASPEERSVGRPQLPAGCPTPAPTSGPPMDADPPATEPPTTIPYTGAVGIAVSALAAYADHWTAEADPAVRSRRWLAEIAPYLSPAARAAYAGTDPASVPVHQLSGPPAQAAMTSPYLATVQQNTDVGLCTVQLARRDADGAWQVERIELPPGLH